MVFSSDESECLFPNTIRGIETGKCTIEDFSGRPTEWYSIVMNAISKYHSGIIATDKCTIENFNGTEWYSVVINSISKYHSRFHCVDRQVYIEDFSDID